MFSNPHEFVSEVWTVVCFGRLKCRILYVFMKLMRQPEICLDKVVATPVSDIPTTSVIHFSLRCCQIIFLTNIILDVHIFMFH
jgi:hypothetical protein